MTKAVFWDRDGVFNELVDRGSEALTLDEKVRFTAPWFYDEFKPKNGITEVLNKTKEMGFLNFLVTNQPDVTYGNMPATEFEKIMAVVKTWGLDDIYVCQHGQREGCECKKPKPGMLLSAARKHDIDLARSFMVGDTPNDMKAGKAAGCTTILITTDENHDAAADVRVNDLNEVIKKIEQLKK